MLKYIAVIILSASTFFSTPYRYFQSQQLQKTAYTLATQNKYSDALKKYEEAQKVWNSEDTSIKIQNTKETLENYEYYQEGSKFIDKKIWDEAIISLSKVRKPSKYFDTAQSLLDFAKGKIGEKKEKEMPEVKGLNSDSNKLNYVEKIVNPMPTTTIPPIPLDSSTQTQTVLHIYPTITDVPIPTPDTSPKDSYGNLCTSYKSHCKYGCSVPDSNVDYRINTISMHTNQLNSCKTVAGADCSVWENGLKTDFSSLIQYCGSDFLNHL